MSLGNELGLLDPQLPVTARNGHVILACSDNQCSADVGGFVVPLRPAPSHSWLQSHDEVLLTAADLGLVRLRVPRGYSVTSLQAALHQWLGRPRCAGAGLHRMQVPRAAIPVFCLTRPEVSTLTVVLADICDTLGEILIDTIDSPTNMEFCLSNP